MNLVNMGVNATLDFYQTIAVEQLHLPGIVGVVTGVGSPFLNVVLDMRTQKTDNQALIPVLRDFFNSHAVPWSWFVMANAVDPDLEAEGFTVLEAAPSLYFDLTQPLPINPRPDIRIVEMTQADDLLDWIQPLNEGFPNTDPTVDQDAYRKLNAQISVPFPNNFNTINL